MTIFKFLASAAALVAAPAAAQYYPQTYPSQYQQQYQQQYPGYGYGQGYGQQGYGYQQPYAQNPIGQIIDQLLGNRYSVTERTAVSRCASAAVAQAQSQYGGGYNGHNGYNGYSDQGDNDQGDNQGYNRGYRGQGYGALRVTAITEVQRRSNGLRVSGLLSQSGGYGGYNQGYGNQGYGNRGDLSFRCDVGYNGAVTGVRVRANNGYRG